MSQQAYAPPSGQAARRWLPVVVVAFLVLGLIYSGVVPLFEAPDEVWHFAFADHLAKGGGLPEFKEASPPFCAKADNRLCIMPSSRWRSHRLIARTEYRRTTFPAGCASTPATRPSRRAQRATL